MFAQGAKQCHLRFEFRNPPIALGESGRDVCGLEALRDVLWAIGIPSDDAFVMSLMK